MAGVAELRTAIRRQVAALYGADYDAEYNHVTAGGHAVDSSPRDIAAFVLVATEVIVFEPVLYDS
ncbi:hypothetical protein [Candidatus Accumulibacter sp. ACC007]|uniref:hypothetical protein n=1 Tax=Candidatus Accumulibacter sp. ACC007 TaxID=2823333 RepID=UPI0025BE9D2A|nr:hypothetical protein [Candidatus Accumulibacter sp. ACC007]